MVITMTERKPQIIDISDGSEVAGVVVGLYCNGCSFAYDSFINQMLMEKSDVQHNFTVLCLEWFRELAKESYYDKRNEDSVMLARKISQECGDAPLHKNLNPKGIEKFIEIRYVQGGEIEKLTVSYLKTSCKDYMPFIQKTMSEHKTLQQNFSRLCIKWFSAVCRMNPKSKKSHIAAAAKVMKLRIYLRHI